MSDAAFAGGAGGGYRVFELVGVGELGGEPHYVVAAARPYEVCLVPGNTNNQLMDVIVVIVTGDLRLLWNVSKCSVPSWFPQPQPMEMRERGGGTVACG